MTDLLAGPPGEERRLRDQHADAWRSGQSLLQEAGI